MNTAAEANNEQLSQKHCESMHVGNASIDTGVCNSTTRKNSACQKARSRGSSGTRLNQSTGDHVETVVLKDLGEEQRGLEEETPNFA